MTDDQMPTGIHQPHVFGPHAAHYATITFLCEIYDDLEKVWVANSNRVGTLTREGMTDQPETVTLQATVAVLAQEMHRIDLELRRAMRKHPLGPWCKSIVGVGERQAPRLLGAIGDPYWNEAAGRPRRGPAELWAYCGYHVIDLPADHQTLDAHTVHVGGDHLPLSGQTATDTQMCCDGETKPPADQNALDANTVHVGGVNSAGGDTNRPPVDDQTPPVGVAARRQRGVRANWNADAKMRAYLIAKSCIRQSGQPDINGKVRPLSPYRTVYDKRKENTAGRPHATPCVRCGPKGKAAQVGSPWSDAHRDADALRIVAKEILKDLWREAKRVHTTEGE